MSLNISKPDQPICIIGAGGHARVVMDIICSQFGEKYIEGIYDDSSDMQGRTVCNKIVKPTTEIKANSLAIVAIGSNNSRKSIVSRFQSFVRWAVIVHPTAWICKGVTIGEGTVVCAGAIVQPEAMIGKHVILNTACRIDHHCQISDFVHIAPSCTLCGNVSIHQDSFIGAASVVRQGILIEKDVIVGCGSVVVKAIKQGSVAIGVPAKPIKTV